MAVTEDILAMRVEFLPPGAVATAAVVVVTATPAFVMVGDPLAAWLFWFPLGKSR